MSCWASSLGECDGGLSREHIISDALFEGDSVYFRGFKWCRDEGKTVGKASAVAKILCIHHNNLLSPCDAAAKELKLAMKSTFAQRSKRIKKKFKQVKTVNADLFSRWICKTACNAFAVDGRVFDGDLVRYAFGQRTQRSYHTYVRVSINAMLRPNYDHLSFTDLNASDETGELILLVSFYGVDWLLTNHDIQRSEFISIGDKEKYYTGDFREGIKEFDVDKSAKLRFIWGN